MYEALKKRFPDLRLFVVGPRPIEAVRALARDPSIIVTGFVDDVRPYVARASVVIAPFVSGTGIKNKVLEGMAMGKPVVTTSIGARGINATRENICVSQTVMRLLLLTCKHSWRIQPKEREWDTRRENSSKNTILGSKWLKT